MINFSWILFLKLLPAINAFVESEYHAKQVDILSEVSLSTGDTLVWIHFTLLNAGFYTFQLSWLKNVLLIILQTAGCKLMTQVSLEMREPYIFNLFLIKVILFSKTCYLF